jgi:chromosome segregation ATPase
MLKLDASGLNAANRALGAEVFKLQEKSSSVEIRIEDIYNRLNNMATDTPEDEDSRQMVETLKHELDLLVEDLRIDMEEHSNSVITDVHQASTKFATMQSNIDAFENRIIALEGRLNSAQGQLDASFAKSLVNI